MLIVPSGAVHCTSKVPVAEQAEEVGISEAITELDPAP